MAIEYKTYLEFAARCKVCTNPICCRGGDCEHDIDTRVIGLTCPECGEDMCFLSCEEESSKSIDGSGYACLVCGFNHTPIGDKKS